MGLDLSLCKGKNNKFTKKFNFYYNANIQFAKK